MPGRTVPFWSHLIVRPRCRTVPHGPAVSRTTTFAPAAGPLQAGHGDEDLRGGPHVGFVTPFDLDRRG